MIRVRVPCTSANLGPGFDCLGIALSLYCDCAFEERESGLVFEGVEERFCNENNLAVTAYRAAMLELGIPCKGLFVSIRSDIPTARGLGSSAALIAAGVYTAFLAHGAGGETGQMLKIAARLEGHPDNAAPALMGDLVLSSMRDGEVLACPVPVNEKWRFCVCIPEFELKTEDSRRVLPGEVPFGDAVSNVSCSLMLVRALETGDEALLRACARDRLHQPYRRKLIPGYDEVEKALFDCGACGVTLSGAGPTILGIGTEDSMAEKMRICPLYGGVRWRSIQLTVDRNGVRENGNAE